LPQAIIYLSQSNDLIVNKFSKKWGLSKHETILRIIERFDLIKEEKDATGI